MKSKIAEDLRLAGNAKFYHPISYTSLADIKADVAALMREHGEKYTLEEYVSLFTQADYWLEPSLVNRKGGEFKELMAELQECDFKAILTDEYAKAVSLAQEEK